jgi:non-ribosomal peptide synthetase component F
MLKDAESRMILSNRKNLNSLASPENQLIVLIDEENDVISRESIHAPSVKMSGRDLAYAMYTSGSTGRPKGVMIENRNVVSLVRDVNYVNLSVKNVLLSTGSPSFDASSFEYWAMLLNGENLHYVLKKFYSIVIY